MKRFLFVFLLILPLGFAPAQGEEFPVDREWWSRADLADVQRLLASGADPSAAVGARGWTPLHLAARFNNDPAVIAALIEAGVDP